MSRFATLLAPFWLWTLFLILLFVGTATQEGFYFRQLCAGLSFLLLIPILLTPELWERFRQSRWIGIGVVAIMVLALAQLLPLGLGLNEPARVNIAAEACLLDTSPSPFLTYDPLSTVRFLGFCVLLLSVWMAVSVLGKKAGQYLQQIIIAVGLTSLTWGTVQLFMFPSNHLLWDNFSSAGMVGPFANASHLATFMLISLAYASMGFFRARRRPAGSGRQSRLFFFAGCGLLFCSGILATGSIGALAICFALIILSILIGLRFARELLARLIGTGLIVGGIGFPLLYIGVSLTGLVKPPGQDLGTIYEFSRQDMWAIGSASLKDHLLLGTGFGAFDEVFPFYEQTGTLSRTFANELHNDIFQLIIEGGIILFLIYGVFLRRCSNLVQQQFVRRDFSFSMKAPALLGCLAVFTQSFFDYAAQNWIIAALLVAMLTIGFDSSPNRIRRAEEYRADVVVL